MKTLKEFSVANPQLYIVHDRQLKNGDLKNWDDDISITDTNTKKVFYFKRKSAYKFGLAEKAN
jgi:hypothetical protein